MHVVFLIVVKFRSMNLTSVAFISTRRRMITTSSLLVRVTLQIDDDLSYCSCCLAMFKRYL